MKKTLFILLFVGTSVSASWHNPNASGSFSSVPSQSPFHQGPGYIYLTPTQRALQNRSFGNIVIIPSETQEAIEKREIDEINKEWARKAQTESSLISQAKKQMSAGMAQIQKSKKESDERYARIKKRQFVQEVKKVRAKIAADKSDSWLPDDWKQLSNEEAKHQAKNRIEMERQDRRDSLDSDYSKLGHDLSRKIGHYSCTIQ